MLNDKEVKDQANANAIADAEKAKAEFDKDRQRADQAEANFRKAQAEKEHATTQLSQLQQQMDAQQKQLAELKAQGEASKSIADNLPTLTEDATIEDIARVVTASHKIIADQAKELAALKTKASRYEEETGKERQEREARERRNKVLEEVCTELEEEFGAGIRNDALKLMEKVNEEQGLPVNPAKAVLRLRQCYKKVSEDKTTETKKATIKAPVTDTGGGGSRPSFGNTKIKKGSLSDVSTQYGKLNSDG
jgi:hypothetical protein